VLCSFGWPQSQQTSTDFFFAERVVSLKLWEMSAWLLQRSPIGGSLATESGEGEEQWVALARPTSLAHLAVLSQLQGRAVEWLCLLPAPTAAVRGLGS